MSRPNLERTLLVAATLAFGIYLLRGARVAGKDDFDRAMLLLDDLSAADAQLDAEVLRLAYGLKLSYDDLAQLEASMRAQLTELSRAAPAGRAIPKEEAEKKLLLSEDFKTEFSVHRNSVAIAGALARAAIRDAGAAGTARFELYRLENAVWRFIANNGGESSSALSERLAELDSGGLEGSAAAPHWSYLRNHVQTLLVKEPIIHALVDEYFEIPLEARIQTLRSEMRSDFEVSVRSAAYHGVGLFGLALVLLGYGTRKAYLAHRYVGLLEGSNASLEVRVEERTAELRQANEALAREMKERSEMETRLRLAQKLEAIGQLAAGVAHEINTPCQYVSDNLTFVQDSWASLGPLLSACQSAADAEDPAGGPAAIADLWREADADFLRDEVANAIAESHEGMKQIRDTVRALKEFSHPDSDEMQLGDVNRLVENALMVARNEYKYVADIVKELAEPPPVAPCFVSLINQVLINLIVNSAHAIGEKCRADPGTRGRITVSSRLESDHVVLSVEDDGPGIPEEIRGKIFDPFFTTKEVGKGTGQGLAITHRIVEDHAGKIEVESTPGVGTKISIMLPTRQATQHGAPQLSHA